MCENNTLFFKPSYGGSVIAYTKSKNFSGIVYQRYAYGFPLDGPVICYDLDLNIKKKGGGDGTHHSMRKLLTTVSGF